MTKHFTFINLNTKHVRFVYPQRQKRLTVLLSNKTEKKVTVHLRGYDERAAYQFVFQSNIVHVHAHEEVTIPLQIITSPQFVFLRQTTCPFTVMASTVDETRQMHTIRGTVQMIPFMGRLPVIFFMACIPLLFFISFLFMSKQTTQPKHVEYSVQVDSTATMSDPDWWRDKVSTKTPQPSATSTRQWDKHNNDYESMFKYAGTKYKLDWELLAAIAYVESSFNPQATGKDNDMGLMQVIPSTWHEVTPTVGVTDDPYDPYNNILVGAAYLAYVRDYCQAQGLEYPKWTLVGYNWGINNINKLLKANKGWNDVPPKQKRYAMTILQRYNENYLELVKK
ncbi:MAG: hypothetical protein B6242_01505 [Anaerolineaceae bacterium 4572_78]|nr:MAG: hypothetical protein B6242_01505 [Anaerolineaceae bacterium 4572_78]